VTKARGSKVAVQEGSLKVMPHAPGSARKCEGIGPHTPSGSWNSGGLPNVQRAIAEVKT